MSRLRKINNKIKMSKTASTHMHISSFILKSGDVIGISARTVNWKPWYQVFLEYDQGAASSFYDGPDQSKAFQYYMDLLTAFKGVSEAEAFRKHIPQYQHKLIHLERKPQDQEYHNLLMRTPKFLGVSDWG
jgi:hypothetical protein